MSEQTDTTTEEGVNDHNTLTQGGCLEVITAAINGETILRTPRSHFSSEICKTKVTEWSMGKYVYSIKPARVPDVGDVWSVKGDHGGVARSVLLTYTSENMVTGIYRHEHAIGLSQRKDIPLCNLIKYLGRIDLSLLAESENT